MENYAGELWKACLRLVRKPMSFFTLVVVARDLGYDIFRCEITQASFGEFEKLLKRLRADDMPDLRSFQDELIRSAIALSGKLGEDVSAAIRLSLAEFPASRVVYTKAADILFGGQQYPGKKWWKRVGKLASTN